MTAVDFINETHGWAAGWGGYTYRTIHGNSLGTRLWTGMTDPIFLSIAGSIAAVVVIVSGVFIRRRRRKSAYRLPDVVSESPSIE
ncbi:MAG: LPXTG cell wall anchor domain-containing protein [Candidatus Thorarchaeota archaeon]|nr:MAG: LPXTG cell wall anchor domain-containing protein [Candidatus Thorarchaeota archaeon]